MKPLVNKLILILSISIFYSSCASSDRQRDHLKDKAADKKHQYMEQFRYIDIRDGIVRDGQ